jgi:hypothetical protein
MIFTIALAELAVVTAAMIWHAITGHHWHWKLIAAFRPGVQVPPARHDTGWHALPWWKRAIANAAVAAGAALTGLAWFLSPGATVVIGILVIIAVLLTAGLRILGRRASTMIKGGKS